MRQKIGCDWTQPPALDRTDLVLRARAYERALGMPTRRALARQLDVDLPRSTVCVDGVRTRDSGIVMAATRMPRLATQAVYAPVIEWLLRHKLVSHEPSARRAMRVDIDTKDDRVTVTKRLRLLRWSGEHVASVIVVVDAHSRSDTLVVSLQRDETRTSTRFTRNPCAWECGYT